MIEITTKVELTPEELAEEFWNMDDQQQSAFFNKLGSIVEHAQGRGILQLDYIILSDSLRDNGRKVIKHLYESLEDTYK